MLEQWMRKWNRVPLKMVVRAANQCSPGVDWQGSAKSVIVTRFWCSWSVENGRMNKDAAIRLYRVDVGRERVHHGKFLRVMDRLQTIYEQADAVALEVIEDGMVK